MSQIRSTFQTVALGLATTALVGCAASQPEVQPGPVPDGGPPTFEQAQATAEEAARVDREAHQNMTFEEFEATIYKEPFEGGKYVVNGDTTIADRKHLEEFFEQEVLRQPPQPEEGTVRLIVHQVGGLDAVWNSADKQKLTYCVSTAFGSRHDQVVNDMAAAGAAWEAVADVDFIHIASQDSSCTAGNSNVTFDVRPVNVNGEYLARAFFPNDSRFARNVLIDDSSFQLDPNDNLQLVGILRHELGHTLGFRHEHTRPQAGRCFEDSNWRPLTDYDPFSVMHYPQCNGLGDWTLTLTSADQTGAACLYGPTAGFPVQPSDCPDGVIGGGGGGPVPGTPVTETFDHQSVARREVKHYGPFAVAAGTLFEAEIAGRRPAGDPDLYVRFGREPTVFSYDCRPYLSGAEERCAVDVPSDESQAFVMVRGYRQGNYDLSVTYTPPATAVSLVTD